jgi:hypothetical protein
MTPAHIILWHAASSRYVICQASRSRGVTVYQMVSGATYEYEADAQRHIDALNNLASGGANAKESSAPAPPVSGTAGVSGK